LVFAENEDFCRRPKIANNGSGLNNPIGGFEALKKEQKNFHKSVFSGLPT
jgi:hypothetical protein